MLRELRVRNLAVIESATAPFSPGLNVLTGETGAGKSILVDAITLLLGERAQPQEAIRASAETATIEGVFRLPPKSPVAALLKEHGIPLENGELVIRRELVRGGRGRVFLNDANATLGLLERIGEALVEVHGQHEHQGLMRPGRHLDILDAFAGLGILRDRLRQRYEEWRQATAELAALRDLSRDRAARLDACRAGIDEIDAARLRAGEEEELREERRRLQNAERLLEGAHGAYQALYDVPGAAVARVGQAAATLRELGRIDAGLAPTVQALDVAAIQLDEAVRALRSYRTAIVFDPPRLEEIERRLDEIGRLKRRHDTDVPGLLALRSRLAAELEALGHGDEDAERLGQRVDRLRGELVTRAADLAERREQAASRLEAAAAAELAELDLEGAVLRVRLERTPAGEGEVPVGPSGWRLGPRGVDHVELLFSANSGEDPKPLARIASGGELSRTMLALKAVLAAADAVPVLIFDEVDAGIGGRTADVVGRKLRQVARARQVLCITHLPQIAAYADHHLRVEKADEAGRTAAAVTALAARDRVREVARMLGGEAVTDTSLRHAQALIQQARGK